MGEGAREDEEMGSGGEEGGGKGGGGCGYYPLGRGGKGLEEDR